MKSEKSIQQQILDLLRDCEQTRSEIGIELKMPTSTITTSLTPLLQCGLLVEVDNSFPTTYTSNYDKLSVKVYTAEDDDYEKVQTPEKTNPTKTELESLIFKKPDIVVYNDKGYRVIQLVDELFKKFYAQYIIHPFLDVSTELIKRLHFDIGVPMEDLENCDRFKIINRDDR